MAHNSSSTSSSSLNFPSSTTSDSSTYSSPYCWCSAASPPSLPQEVRVQSIVPFVWEEKPGVTKPLKGPCTSSSSALESDTTSVVYNESLEFPPLRPPPRLSQAFLSQPRVRSDQNKLSSARSFVKERRQQSRLKKAEEGEDPFFLALKACTKVEEDDCSAMPIEDRASYDGLHTAFRGLFKPASMKKRTAQGIEEKSSGKSLGKAHGRGKLASSTGLLDTFMSENERNKALLVDASLHTALSSANEKGKDSSESGSFKRVGFRDNGKGSGLASRSKNLHGHLIGTNPVNSNYKRHKVGNQQVHGKPKRIARVVEFTSCGHGTRTDHHRHSRKHSLLTELLGCKNINPLNGSVIHPALMYRSGHLSSHR